MSGLKEVIKKLIPEPLTPPARRLYHAAHDRLEVWTGRRDPLTPPKRMWHWITSPDLDFKAEGEGLRGFLVEECGLKPDESVLDVGCGIGRNAVPLIGHVRSYDGFDIMPDAVRWCQENITPRHPNFRFSLADVRNERYNPTGARKASEYRFPYGDDSFDLVFLISVFTHMLPRDMENYLSEIARVLKPGGRCAVSYMLLNDEARRNIEKGAGALDFGHEIEEGCFAQLPELPEAAVAYEEERVRALYDALSLRIREPIRYGTWSSAPAMMQDIIVAFKVSRRRRRAGTSPRR
ncbi:MAG TPA: class I SAM-dependent methyltransferase [Pyrinomonadaceae bacterium]|nr:class I SAM-dependent methyltransferase [Pyrinomonadaceae bacterium]